MKKTHKKYHLAVSFNKYPEIALINNPKQPVGGKRENEGPRHYDSLENMFTNNFEIRLRKLEIEQRRNYEVVGYKEIQDINLRLERKKRLIQSGTKEEKLTQISRNSLNKHNLDYLTKEEVIKCFSPHYATAPSSRRQKERPKEGKSLDSSKVMKKMSKKGIAELKRHKNNHSQEFSLCKLRQKMEQYQSGWIRQIEQKRQLVRKVMKPSYNPMISVIESVDEYRTAYEDKEKALLEEKSLTPSMWEKILRTSQEIDRNFKEITNISVNGLKSIGRDKYRKQLEWLQDKDRSGFFFKKDRSLINYSQPCCE